jgi:cytochrome c-type biogenesis protein CcmF
MWVELGHFCLILALLMAVLQSVVPAVGVVQGRPRWQEAGCRLAQAQGALVALAFAALVHAFVSNDFSVDYVAQHSNSSLPWAYRVAATWGGHEGSVLLWALMLSGWTVAVTWLSDAIGSEMRARVLAVLGVLSTGFIAFTLFTSNPFERLLPAAADGRDLNPLLQDPGMVLHPPMLYMGYVGFSVAFACAVSALWSGQLAPAWARWSRPWTLAAWASLTLGIALGSAWAYYELGWGGWWFWDPVENASLMPWLVGTALLHSLIVSEKRNTFRVWTAALAIIAFSLSLLGTFLVRSGVLSSVHAFAVDPQRGLFILGFLGLVAGGGLALLAWRAPQLAVARQPEHGFEPLSRESALLANNVVMLAAMGSVLLGTLYPLAMDTLGLGKISVGPPYFEAVMAPLLAPALFLMGLGPLSAWRRERLPSLLQRVRWAAAVSGLTLVVATVLWGLGLPVTLGVGLGVTAAVWVLATTGLAWWQRGVLQRHPAAFYGMLLAHGGVAVFVLGVTVVKGFEAEQDVRLSPGQSAVVQAYTVRLDAVTPTNAVSGPNFRATRATLTVWQGERLVTQLHPEKRIYTASRMPMTEAAIDRGVWRDLYVSLGEVLPDGAWSVRVHVKPMVNWIWGGCLLMGLGGLMAAFDRRYRRVRSQSASDPLLPHGVASMPVGAAR